MNKLYVDIETYSPVDLKKSNVYRYTEHPDFRILMAAYAYNDGPVAYVEGDDVYDFAADLSRAGVDYRVAHNAAFERVCFSRALGKPLHKFLPPEEWHDTMAVAASRGLPQGLDNLARALGVAMKDAAGTALINWFCRPDRAGARRLPGDHMEKWLDFGAYCEQDVVVLREVDRALGGFVSATERRVYEADQEINDRGMAVDVPLARAAVKAAAANQKAQVAEIQEIAGIANPNSGPQMLAWLRAQGLNPPNLRAETVSELLSGPLPDEVRRVLTLRQELALVASKKFQAALDGVSHGGRLRGQYRYFGAHTGRWTGRGVQPQNLPREAFLRVTEAGKEYDDTGEAAALADLSMGLGADALTLKKLVRPMFTGPLTVVDFAAIEARVIAWLSGEEWALEAFRAGRDIYVETAERMSTPTNKLDRSQGKVAVLALGYNGGVGSLRVMGASGTDAQLKTLVYQWRRANQAIVQFWADLEDAFYRGGEAGRIVIEKRDKDRLLHLPSGRPLTYRNTAFRMDQRGRRATFWSPQGYRTDTYGGRLAENVTQAVARDVLAAAILGLKAAGYRVVGHIHDEVLVEGDDLPGVQDVMTRVPEWATGLPLDGAGFVCERYRKD